MKKIITLLSLGTFITLNASSQESKSEIRSGDSVKIVIGDTIRIENSETKGKVEISIKDIIDIFKGGEKVIVEHEDDDIIVIEKGVRKENKPENVQKFPNTKTERIISAPKKKELVSVRWLMVDWGLNGLHDKTNYASQATQDFVRVPTAERNARLFDLKPVASMNVNLWPVIINFNVVNNSTQRVILSSGLGFQWYNFKFNTPVSFAGGMNPHVYLDNTHHFTKNKLGVSYGSIPLLLTMQSKISRKHWLTYGAGLIGGYRLASWTKQVSKEDGKVKDRDNFNMNPFQFSATGEIGVKGILRFYGVYQLTNMWDDNSLKMQPFAIGVRFLGI